MLDRKGLMAYAVTPWRSLAWTLVQLQQVHLAAAGSTAEAVSAGRGMADGVTFPAANGGTGQWVTIDLNPPWSAGNRD